MATAPGDNPAIRIPIVCQDQQACSAPSREVVWAFHWRSFSRGSVKDYGAGTLRNKQYTRLISGVCTVGGLVSNVWLVSAVWARRFQMADWAEIGPFDPHMHPIVARLVLI